MRLKDLFLRIPRWVQRPSGLFVPSEISRPVLSEAPSRLPPGVSVPGPDLFVIGSLPSSFDQMRVFLGEEALGLRESTPEDVVRLARKMSFEICVVALAQLAAHSLHMRGQTEEQIRLAEKTFGAPELVQRMRDMARQMDTGLEVFAEQHLTALQRLLVLHARDRALGEEGDDEQVVFNQAFIAVTCLTAEANLGTPNDEQDRAGWLAYLIQNGTYNRTEGSLESMTRPQVLFRDIASDPELEDHPDYCPVDEWMTGEFGFSVAEQFALGFAVLAGAKPLHYTVELHRRMLLAPDYLPELAERIDREPEAAAELLSATRGWYRERFSAGEQTTARAAWERTAFEIRPLLRLADGRLLLVSPRAIESWLGDGFYHRALAAARARDQDERFLRFYGTLVERYALGLLQQAHPEPRLPGSGRVFSEQTYGPGNGKRSPDISVDCGPDLVLIEVTSGRFTLRTLLEGSPEAALRDLGRLVFGKVNQLGDRIDDLLAGDWAPPDVDLSIVERIWPVVITADVLQNELLWDAITEELPPGLRHARIEPLTLLDLADLEQIVSLIEAGHSLARLVARKASGIHARLDFRRFVSDSSDLTHELHPTALIERWEDAVIEAAQSYGFDVDRNRVRRQTGQAQGGGD